MDAERALLEQFINEQELSTDEARDVLYQFEERLTEKEWEIMYGDFFKKKED